MVCEEIMLMVCGKKLDEGSTRIVYQHALLEDRVVKIEYNGLHYCNANEAQIWAALKYTPLAKWLAPIYLVSPYGRCIIQAKCPPLPPNMLPAKVPAFLHNDLKPMNWGLFEGRAVCFDFGNIALFDTFGKGASARLVKADWPKEQASSTTNHKTTCQANQPNQPSKPSQSKPRRSTGMSAKAGTPRAGN
jgi:hypothetical protein